MLGRTVSLRGKPVAHRVAASASIQEFTQLRHAPDGTWSVNGDLFLVSYPDGALAIRESAVCWDPQGPPPASAVTIAVSGARVDLLSVPQGFRPAAKMPRLGDRPVSLAVAAQSVRPRAGVGVEL